jgi:methylmalonyl-CoA/ethylmalonyl-CoA epimerase
MSEPAAPGPFGALHHIGILVEDLDAASTNIQALLDGELVEGGVDEQLSARWQFIAVAGSPLIEVLTPAGDGPIADYFSKHGPGVHHLSFEPASLDASLEHTRRCGLDIVGENRDHSGHEEFFVQPKLTGGALFHSFRALTTK